MWTIRNKQSFTLLELLLAALLSVLVGMALVSTFSAGLKSFHRAQVLNGPKRDTLLCLEKMEKDLRNTFVLSTIPFKGDKYQLSFASLMEGQVAETAYTFNRQTGVLARQQQPYIKPVVNMQGMATLKNIEFAYIYVDPKTKMVDEKDFWQKTTTACVPHAVKIKVIFKGENEDITLQRTVLIPAAG